MSKKIIIILIVIVLAVYFLFIKKYPIPCNGGITGERTCAVNGYELLLNKINPTKNPLPQ